MAIAQQQAQVQELDQVELSILMPCLDEAETIEVCIEKALAFLARSGISGEVVVADNGSTDGSIELAGAKGARVVHVAERGYGAALRAGIAAARGRYVIMGDGDDSYDFLNLDAYVSKLREGVDLVVGNRFDGGIGPGAMPFLHRYLVLLSHGESTRHSRDFCDSAQGRDSRRDRSRHGSRCERRTRRAVCCICR